MKMHSNGASMSVLIKNMEMPKSCDKCPFCIVNVHDRGNDSLCKLIHKEVYPFIGTLPDDCPLIEVPTPHGRLIDADCCNDYFYEHMSDDMMIAAMNAINEMPTIIPADKEEYKCESCVYNPPSSCDGKPCTQCDTRNPLTNCYIQADKDGKK